MSRYGTTAGDRHPRCGGTWRGPLPVDEGQALVCNGCSEELLVPVHTWACGVCGRRVTGNAVARRAARVACTRAHAAGAGVRPVARRRR